MSLIVTFGFQYKKHYKNIINGNVLQNSVNIVKLFILKQNKTSLF